MTGKPSVPASNHEVKLSQTHLDILTSCLAATSFPGPFAVFYIFLLKGPRNEVGLAGPPSAKKKSFTFLPGLRFTAIKRIIERIQLCTPKVFEIGALYFVSGIL